VVVQQDSELNDGLKREWVESRPSPDRNYGYAFQWFAMAVALLIYLLGDACQKTKTRRAAALVFG